MLDFGPSSRRQVPVECESLPEIWNLMPDASSGALVKKCDEFHESREAGTSGCAKLRPARWQRGGQRNQRRKRACTCAEDITACALRSRVELES